MFFDSFSAFIAMNGYGDYVWKSYGITVFLMAGLVVWPIQQRRRWLQEQQRRRQREQQQHAPTT